MRYVTAGVVAAVLGCSSPATRPGVDPRVDAPPAHDLRYEGALGVPVPATLVAGLLTVPVRVNGVEGPSLLVDTGSPMTYVDPAQFSGAQVRVGIGTVASLAVGGLTVHGVPTIGYGVFAGEGIGGLLGSSLICQFVANFDYRARRFALGPEPAPDGVESPGSALTFQLRGGGYGVLPGELAPTRFPATRIVVTAQIDGADHRMLVDTGASFVLLRATAFARVVADGRRQLDLPLTTVDGTAVQHVARLRTIAVGGAAVAGVPVMTLPELQIAGISDELGGDLDGIVGVAYLREFLLTIDYPHTTLRLQRYATRDHISDEFQRVGFILRASGTGFAVGQVIPGTDAATQGLAAGPGVLTVDGQAVDGLAPEAADRLLRGTPGTTRQVVLADRTVTLRVEDVLPLP